MVERYDPIKIEKEILEFWKENSTYERIKNKNKELNQDSSLDKSSQGKSRGKGNYYFLDGPPYTSGKVHLGTAWNKALKDAILRYKRMQGFDVWDRAGYDMHGLPTEHATEKKLNLDGKEDIKKFGVGKFIEECKKLCISNMKIMNDDFTRLGVWMDFENAYQSITNNFIDGEWWLIKKAHENKRLYRGLRTMTWCKDCATALAKHELEYENVEDVSIFVKFKVKGTKNEYLIIWTTTPWTIPFNIAVMVNPELDYVKAQVDDEVWILSDALGPMVVRAVAEKEYKELEKFKGMKLEGLKYEHFFDKDMHYADIECKNPDGVHTVIMSSEYVDTSAGTGLVHCAPGCGPEDYEVGYRNGLPAFNTLDEKGVFPKSTGRFAGLTAKKDDQKFIDFMEEQGVLIATSDVEHDYAHCWRCHNPVVFRTTKQWFFKVEDIKQDMIKENNKIKWVPQTAYNAFNSWLENLRDNSISKQRYWGTPLPIWMNEKDEEDYLVIGSIKELEELSGNKVEDPHIPKIDDITISKNGKKYVRVPDILDVWVDAGTVSWNCLDYPHKTDIFDKLFPADFILEGKDQIRGWFNLLHVASMISMRRPSFKAVYMHGFVQDSQGRKMSKSAGNYILPQEVVEKYGADTFRYYTIGGANPGIDLNYNPEDVELKHKNLHVLWNLHNFMIDFFRNNNIKYGELKLDIGSLDVEERYMLSVLNNKIKQATEAFEGYRINEVPLIVEELFIALSRGYIQLIREKAIQGTETQKNNIAYVMAESMLAILKMFAPIAPFKTEKIFQDVKHLFNLDSHSVHDCEWPGYDDKMIDDNLEKDINNVNAVIQGILYAREKAQLGVRWPVKEVTVASRKKETIKSVESLKEIVLRQTNVKAISTVEEAEKDKGKIKPEEQAAEFRDGMIYLDKTRTQELEAEGFTREIIRRVQSLRKQEGMQRNEQIELFLQVPSDLVEGMAEFEKQVKLVTGAVGIMLDSNGPDKEYSAKAKAKIKGKEIEIYFNKA